jgi:hypothetical protein
MTAGADYPHLFYNRRPATSERGPCVDAIFSDPHLHINSSQVTRPLRGIAIKDVKGRFTQISFSQNENGERPNWLFSSLLSIMAVPSTYQVPCFCI